MYELELLLFLIYGGGLSFLLIKAMDIYDDTEVTAFRDFLWAMCLSCWPALALVAIFRSKSNER